MNGSAPKLSATGRQDRLALERDLLDLPVDLLDDLGGQRRVEQIGRVLLAVVAGPPQELRQRAALARVGLIAVDEQPREAGNRVRLVTGSVGQRHPKVSRHGLGRRRRGRCRAVDRGLDELAGLVADLGHRLLIGSRVRQLDVADRSGRVFHLPGHALVALAAEPHRPLHRGAAADLLVPLRAHLTEIVDPDVRGATAVGAMDHEDRLVGQRRA